MGETLSKEQVVHADELCQSQQPDRCPSGKEILELLREIDCQCPWYPQCGSMKPSDWGKIGAELRQEPRAPMSLLITWQRIHHAICQFTPADNILCKPPETSGEPPPYLYPALAPWSEASAPVGAPQTVVSPSEPLGSVLPVPQSSPAILLSPLECSLARAREAGELDLSEDWGGESPGLFPITRGPDPNHPDRVQVTWTGLPYSVLRELNKSNGLKSTFVQGTLEGIAQGYAMLPYDWKTLLK